MELKIEYYKVEEENEVKIKCGKNDLLVSKTSEQWNTEGINEFLVNVATSIPEHEKLDVIYDDKNENSMYKYVCELFLEFANEYNKLIISEMEN